MPARLELGSDALCVTQLQIADDDVIAGSGELRGYPGADAARRARHENVIHALILLRGRGAQGVCQPVGGGDGDGGSGWAMGRGRGVGLGERFRGGGWGGGNGGVWGLVRWAVGFRSYGGPCDVGSRALVL